MAKIHIDVMISSTSQDLPEHRSVVEDAALRLSMFPVAMEHLKAMSGEDAISASLEMVDISEVYVGIFGMRYGFIPDDPRNPDKISITEMEYHRAVERDIPILIFIMDDEHPITVNDMDTDAEKVIKLSAFKNHLKKKHIVGFFDSVDSLRSLVIQGLAREATKAGERAGENDPDTLESKDDLIVPPELLAIPHYILTANFIGRKHELNLLNFWSQSDNAVLVIEAIGGMGKSALTWEWTNRDAQADDYEGRFWYSFYEGGTNMQSFLRDAVAYFRQVPSKELRLNRAELEKELMKILDSRRVLLVLDGLERVLVAYHRFDAAHIRDEQVDEEQRQRKATDPKDGRFLKQLARGRKGKVLLSSRLMPLSLEDAPNVSHEKLSGLAPDDAYNLMLDRGVKAPENPQLMDKFMAQFGYHGLLLNITAGRIKSFRANPGNFEMWYQVFGKDLRDPDLQKARFKLLKYAFEGLEENARIFLSQIAAFQDAVPYETLAVFNPSGKQAPKIVNKPSLFGASKEQDEAYEAYEAYLQEKEMYEQYQTTQEYFDSIANFDTLLNDLTDRGLLNWERDKNTYDLHPVVRGYAFDQLEGQEKTATYNKIYNHFEGRSVAYEHATTINDIYNAIMMYRALIGAGKLKEGVKYFKKSFADIAYYQLGAYYTIIELLAVHFDNGFDVLPSNLDSDDMLFVVQFVASASIRVGELNRARVLYEKTLSYAIDSGNIKEIGINFHYMSEIHLELSNIALHFRLNHLAHLSDTQFIEPTFNLFQNAVLTGRWIEAIELYSELDMKINESIITSNGWLEINYAKMKLFQGENIETEIRKIKYLIENGRQIFLKLDLLLLEAHVAEKYENWETLIAIIEDGIQISQKTGDAKLSLFEAYYALALAMLDKNDESINYIEKAIETNLIPRQLAFIYNCATEIYNLLGEINTAKSYAMSAYEYSWANGYPYILWYDLQRAKRNLGSLGLSYPDLPNYDFSSPDELPYEEELLDYIKQVNKNPPKSDNSETAYFTLTGVQFTPSNLNTYIAPYIQTLADIEKIFAEIEGVEYKEPTIQQMIAGSVQFNIGFGDVIKAVVDALSFRKRRAEAEHRELENTKTKLDIDLKQIQRDLTRLHYQAAMNPKLVAESKRIEFESSQVDLQKKYLELESQRLDVEERKLKLERGRTQMFLDQAEKLIRLKYPNLAIEQYVRYIPDLALKLRDLHDSPIEMKVGASQLEFKQIPVFPPPPPPPGFTPKSKIQNDD